MWTRELNLWKGVLALLLGLWGLGSASGVPVAAGRLDPAQTHVTSPKERFGFGIGDDYQLVNYRQLVDYWKKLAQQSDRLTLEEIGKTAEGRTMTMAVLTSPENQRQLGRYRDVARRLALAEGVTEEQARALAAEGKAVVWIDGGLHASEVLGAQQLLELVYQLASMDDAETRRILENVILLAVCVNPDGMDLVSDWYMRDPEPTHRTLAGLPRLYQKYIGHDNNRDFYMVTQPETEAINRVLYREWFPQIVYNHHQTGPPGTVLFAPPFRDPFNYHCDPLVPLGIDLVGAAMHTRFAAEGKPGATMRTGAPYSTWWNGGLRTTAYFHNMIGLLTETIGSPTPGAIPFVPDRQLPRGDLPYPVAPQAWHFRQSIDYCITADRAVLDLAARLREEFLYNIYRMGRNSIDRGSRDSWTLHPQRIAAVKAAAASAPGNAGAATGSGAGGTRAEGSGAEGPAARGGARTAPAPLFDLLRDPAHRDPRGYVLPSDQPDFPTATRFVNTLTKNGVTVLRATQAFAVAGRTYPAGSYVVKTAQAFRPHVLDMFEPQDHPDDVPYPGGPPTPPYDVTGYTLALQMGVAFDRLLDPFDGPFEKIEGLAAVPPGRVGTAENPVGYLLSHRVNDAVVAVNRLLAAGEEVYWLKEPLALGETRYPAGTIFIPARPSTRPLLERLAAERGLNFEPVAARPPGPAFRLRAPRVALCDRYGGSIPSGWIRWLLEQVEVPYRVVYPPELDAGDLAARYDVLILPSGTLPGRGGDGDGSLPDPASVPAEFRGWLGRVTLEKTVPELIRFAQGGGTLLCIGSSTSLGALAGLPVADALAERQADGSERPLPRERFFVPGSLLQVAVDAADPLAYGMPERLDVFFENSPAFRLRPEAAAQGVRPVAWFDGARPLVSGWALGQQYLRDAVAVVDAPLGKGRIALFGPEITFRAQPHASFKFLFNGIFFGPSVPVEHVG